MGPFWAAFGIYFGTILGPFWAVFGTILSSSWDHFGQFLGPFWAVLSSCGDHFGQLLVQFWDFCVILGPPFWGQFTISKGVDPGPQTGNPDSIVGI